MVDLSPVERALLVRAARPGRVRAAAVDLLEGLRSSPHEPGKVLAGGLRDARHLHSAERRLVGDGVRAILHRSLLFERCLGPLQASEHWLSWLVSEGLPAAEAQAHAERHLAFERVSDLDRAEAEACANLDTVEALRVRGGLGRALAEALHRSLGEEAAPFLRACRERAPLDLRVNTLRADLPAAVRSLANDGISVERCALSRVGLRVVGRANVVGSRAYRDGLVEIQDEGSQLLAEVVQPEGELVVDLCAGAGGKTLAMAALSPESALLAADVRGAALDQLRKRSRRASVGRLRIVRLRPDGSWPSSSQPPLGQADRVLVDAPCSGTGTLRRHPEHRLRLGAETLAELPVIQAEILDRAADLVAPGGRLIYATCSVLREENEEVVSALLVRRPELESLPLSSLLGSDRARELGGGATLNLLPQVHGTDGFFAAVLRRLG